MVCEPLKGRTLLPARAPPHPPTSTQACGHDSTSSICVSVRSLQTELVQTVTRAVTGEQTPSPAGESRPEKIQENVRNAIGGKFPLYNLGFGNNLNYNFLESMALENHGLARRIYEDSDANLQLQVCLVLHTSGNEELITFSGSGPLSDNFSY